MKRILLIVASAIAFLAGYGAAVKAWPGVPDRAEYHGYYLNIRDTQGDHVIAGGYPGWVVDAESFIAFIKDKMYNGSPRDSRGAQFTIHTMLGSPWLRTNPVSSQELADWESRVRSVQAYTSWNINYTFTVNSYYQGVGSGPNPGDDAFYYETATRASVVFRNSSGAVVYAIKRDCGNPVVNGAAPGLPANWAATGYTVLDVGNATPGQRVNFWHYIWNYGLTGATIWWAPFDGPGGSPTGLPSPNASNFIQGQQTVNVYNEAFTIPGNAAAGTRYCRLIGWDPVNSAGQRDGRGPEQCVTVVIPAKLKAAMSANPRTMAAGDATSFRPSISATSNASPITVQCSITRTMYPPSGGSVGMGNQPCVTTTGNPNIVIGTGASVTLRSNTYTAPDTIPIGSRVCDVITITNPSDAAYYDNPADRTATDCVTIAKSPYVHFMGDVWAGGGFAAVAPGTCRNGANITTVTRSRALTGDGTTPGSGTTYAAFALGRITSFGSASMARVVTGGIGDNWTFSNINSGNLGFFGAAQHCISDYIASYASAPVLPAGTIDVVTNDTDGAWRVSGSSTIRGVMTPGRQKVYVVSGDVTVDSNITYPPVFGSVDHIPSLVVIATGNIFVRSNVTQMDGIFIARGTVYTCYPKVEPATINTCNNRLTINGSVSSNRLDLFRTAGADGATPPSQKAPAEVFNLSPEVYLKNSLNLNAKTTLNTATIRELPPRF